MYAQSAGELRLRLQGPASSRSVGFGREADELAVREMIAFGSQVSTRQPFYRGVSTSPRRQNLVIDCADLTMQWANLLPRWCIWFVPGDQPNELPSVFAEEFQRDQSWPPSQ